MECCDSDRHRNRGRQRERERARKNESINRELLSITLNMNRYKRTHTQTKRLTWNSVTWWKEHEKVEKKKKKKIDEERKSIECKSRKECTIDEILVEQPEWKSFDAHTHTHTKHKAHGLLTWNKNNCDVIMHACITSKMLQRRPPAPHSHSKRIWFEVTLQSIVCSASWKLEVKMCVCVCMFACCLGWNDLKSGSLASFEIIWSNLEMKKIDRNRVKRVSRDKNAMPVLEVRCSLLYSGNITSAIIGVLT